MITFPTTPEAFIAYQEQLAGQKLSEREKEVTVVWMEAFNLSYKDGLEQDRAALEDSLAKMDELLKRREESPAVHKLLQAARQCIIYAWEQGAERSVSIGEDTC